MTEVPSALPRPRAAARPSGERKTAFAAVCAANTRVLVLGSLPGEASLARRQYYAHPRNGFWPLIGRVLGEDLVSLPYDGRLRALRERGVGLWDVLAEAERDGSLDARIRNHETADLRGLIADLPQLRAVAFNGATAARIGAKELGPPRAGLDLVRLPSSSPALAWTFDRKLEAWLGLRAYLG